MSLKDLAFQVLCPPGDGVFTVNTAREKKAELQNKLYPNSTDILQAWQNSWGQLATENVAILGICSDTGGGILRGANWGPLFLRQKLYEKSIEAFDMGDIRVIPHLLHDKYLNQQTIANCRRALYGEDREQPVSPLSLTETFCDAFYQSFPQKSIFAIGGDHSVSYPLVKSFLRAKSKQKKRIGLVHFDAHTDLLSERLGIDICFGSWVTHILDDLVHPSDCHQIGIRSSGQEKEHWEKTFGIHQHWSAEVITRGPIEIAGQIVEDFKNKKIDELYVSFDIDAIDSKLASATGTPEPNGLTDHQCLIIIQELSKHFPISGADMVEIAPYLNTNGIAGGPQSTLSIASKISHELIQELNRYGRA